MCICEYLYICILSISNYENVNAVYVYDEVKCAIWNNTPPPPLLIVSLRVCSYTTGKCLNVSYGGKHYLQYTCNNHFLLKMVI